MKQKFAAPAPVSRRPLFALALLSVTWGYSWVVTKIGLRDAGPFQYAALRTALGVVCLFLLLALGRQGLRPERVLSTALLGLLQTAGFLLFSNWALVQGGAGKTAVLVFTMPFWTLLLAWPFLGERIQGSQWLSVILALGGLLLVLEPWGLKSTFASKALAVLAGISWAGSAIVAKRMQARKPLDILSLTFWQMVWAMIPITAVAWVVPSRPINWSGVLWLSIVYNGVLTTALGWFLWLYILKSMPAGQAGLSALAIPVFALLASALQLGEVPRASELVGMVLISSALVLISLPKLRANGRGIG